MHYGINTRGTYWSTTMNFEKEIKFVFFLFYFPQFIFLFQFPKLCRWHLFVSAGCTIAWDLRFFHLNLNVLQDFHRVNSGLHFLMSRTWSTMLAALSYIKFGFKYRITWTNLTSILSLCLSSFLSPTFLSLIEFFTLSFFGCDFLNIIYHFHSIVNLR